MLKKVEEMRRKVRNAVKKNTPKKNEASSPANDATPIKNDKTPVKNTTTPDKPSTSETQTRRQTLGQKRAVTPSEKVTSATPVSKKAVDGTTQTKKPIPHKVILAKKAIIAKTASVVKSKDAARKKILTKAKMAKAKKTTRTKLPVRVEENKVCNVEFGCFNACNFDQLCNERILL